MPSPSQAKTADFLERILRVRRGALAEAKRTTPAAKLEERAAAAPPVRDFAGALQRDGINIIAELKKASPSRGLLRATYNPAALAPALERAGAVALSVLTEPEFFQGGLEDLQVARTVSNLPILRKDFLFDPYQLYEARAAGADAFLLIAAVLSPAELRQLITLGRQLRMAALVEVHTAEELERALAAGAEIVGVNNRDLKTFEVSLETSLRLVEAIPDECVAVSESGLRSREDLQRLRTAGFDAFLIGEHLMQASEPDKALRELLTGESA
ncbi:MAG TPA: indole-3-glycerol phosphate synthase TrpC [Candidatus Acidoferrales bacterium]|nr:indole-3-glycerol phosphate synthase TrpC [Candidatus Acidoferrales bacterium]